MLTKLWASKLKFQAPLKHIQEQWTNQGKKVG